MWLTATKWCSKHESAETDVHATIRKPMGTVFSMQSIPKLHNKDKLENIKYGLLLQEFSLKKKNSAHGSQHQNELTDGKPPVIK
jgi:hypothetical protein